MAVCAKPRGNTEVQKGQYESNDFLHKSKGKKKNRRPFYIFLEKICKILRKSCRAFPNLLLTFF